MQLHRRRNSHCGRRGESSCLNVTMRFTEGFALVSLSRRRERDRHVQRKQRLRQSGAGDDNIPLCVVERFHAGLEGGHIVAWWEEEEKARGHLQIGRIRLSACLGTLARQTFSRLQPLLFFSFPSRPQTKQLNP